MVLSLLQFPIVKRNHQIDRPGLMQVMDLQWTAPGGKTCLGKVSNPEVGEMFNHLNSFELYISTINIYQLGFFMFFFVRSQNIQLFLCILFGGGTEHFSRIWLNLLHDLSRRITFDECHWI